MRVKRIIPTKKSQKLKFQHSRRITRMDYFLHKSSDVCQTYKMTYFEIRSTHNFLRHYLVLLKGSNWLGTFISGCHPNLHSVAFCIGKNTRIINP